MKILVFGGSGFLGSTFCALLDKEGIDYDSVSRSGDTSKYNVDISCFEDFIKIPKNTYDVVINCAATLPGGSYLDNKYLDAIYKTNILGTQNICKWIETQHSIIRIINCSTLAVVNKPWPKNMNEDCSTYPSGQHVLYSSSKLTQELIFKTFSENKNISLSQIRFSAIYGSEMKKEGIFFNLKDQAVTNNKIVLTNSFKVSADFLHVKDASKIILATIKNNIKGIINGASGVETTIFQLAEIIGNHISKSIEIENIDADDFIENRSVINVNKLKSIIDVDGFIKLEMGLNELLKK